MKIYTLSQIILLRVFTKLLEDAGLESPFEEETIRKMCSKADEWLKAFDLSNIE